MSIPVSSARAGVVPGSDARPLLTGPLGALLLAGSSETAGGPAFVAHDPVLKPRGVPHAFRNAGDSPARLLEAPGGFEDHFAALADVLPDLSRVAERYGLDIDPASVPRPAQEHGLVLA